MKLYRNALILLVIAGILAATFLIVKNKKDKEDSGVASDTKVEKVLELDKDKIVEITVKNPDGTFVFSKKDKEWILSSPADLKYDKSKIESIATEVSNITVDKVVEENAPDASAYGFDNPVVVTVKMEDGTVKELELGNETDSKSGYYARLKGSGKVYVISTYAGKTLKARKYSILEKGLFKDLKTEDIKLFSMEKRGNIVFSAKKESETSWFITLPIEGNGDASKINTMIDSTLRATVSEFVDEDPGNLGKYGLDKPSYSVEIGTSSNKYRILFGDEKKDSSEIYAKMADGKEVFTVPLGTFNYLDKPLKEAMDVFVYIVNIDEVSRIQVDMDGRTDIFDIQANRENKENDRFIINGKDVTKVKMENGKTGEELARRYYQAIIGITMSELDIGAKPSGEPEVTFTYTLKKAPGTVKIEFIERDDKYYYAVKDGKYTNIIVEKKQFDELRNALKDINEAAAKVE